MSTAEIQDITNRYGHLFGIPYGARATVAEWKIIEQYLWKLRKTKRAPKTRATSA